MTDQEHAGGGAAEYAVDEQLQSSVLAALARVQEIVEKEQRGDLVAILRRGREHAARAGAVTVIVVGEVSRGKSYLINALVEHENLLPVDADVSTGAVVVVRHNTAPDVRVFTKGAPSPIVAPLTDIVEYASLVRNPDNAKQVVRVEVGIPSPLLGEGFCFIDTLGVGGLDASHAAATLAALPYADAVLFVLDASAPISQPELRFLKQAGGEIQTVVVALTKTDIFSGWMTILDEDRKLLDEFAPR